MVCHSGFAPFSLPIAFDLRGPSLLPFAFACMVLRLLTLPSSRLFSFSTFLPLCCTFLFLFLLFRPPSSIHLSFLFDLSPRHFFLRLGRSRVDLVLFLPPS